MADKKKKEEEKPFVDPFILMKTEDLLKQYEKHHANTPEDADRREGYEHEEQGYLDRFESVQNSYLIDKRGKSEKTVGAPKRYALSKKDLNLESSELVNKVLLAMVEADFTDEKGVVNKAALEIYQDHRRLQEYAAGKGINYNEIKQDLIDNYKNIKKAKKYNQIKGAMAHNLVKDLQKISRITNELYTNTARHSKVKSHVRGALEKTGYTLEETVDVSSALDHYANHIQSGGKLDENYVLQHDNDIKKYEKPKPK